MHFRHERVRIETERHELEGTLQLPNEGYRSRTTDFLNAHDRELPPPHDGNARHRAHHPVRHRADRRAPDRPGSPALAPRQVVMVIELEDLGVADEPAPTPLAPSVPP